MLFLPQDHCLMQYLEYCDLDINPGLVIKVVVVMKVDLHFILFAEPGRSVDV